MTRAEVAKLVAVLLAAYPSAKSTAQTSEIYERMLSDLDYPTANAAVERLLATAKFMPSIAEIREAALTMGNGELRPGGDAWGDVLSAVGRFGIYRPPVFADPVVARCVAALGWREICNSENQQADRARFIDLYDELARHARTEQNAGQLPAAQRFKALKENEAASAVVLQLAEKLGGKS